MQTEANLLMRVGDQGKLALRLAADGADRLSCWRLVYMEYLSRGYTERKEWEYRYSIHDALPDTATFLVEEEGKPVGTVSVFPDSPLGLPADEVYRSELDTLRQAGRSLVEVGRLTITGEHQHDRVVLSALFDALSVNARCVQKATDLIITINPSHAKFYERMILFESCGGEKDLGSVCGAPAVLMKLDLATEEQARRQAHGEGDPPGEFRHMRTMYPLVSGLEGERSLTDSMQKLRRPLDEDFLKKYFVRFRPLIQDLPASLRYFIEKCYPEYDLKAVCRPELF